MPIKEDAIQVLLQQMSSTIACENASEPFSTTHKDILSQSFTDVRHALEAYQRKEAPAYPARNRYGRPYISGRPLLTCDRKKIVQLFQMGTKKIHIAKKLGITHSCVSKVLRKFHETGSIEARVSRTASCSCPGSSTDHDSRFCKHIARSTATTKLKFTIENILKQHGSKDVIYYSNNCDNIRK